MATAAQAAAPGPLFAWGQDAFGQLCDGAALPGGNQAAPVAAVAPANAGVTDIAAGAFHSLGVVGGNVFACGRNRFGQLGNNGAPVSSSVPVQVCAPAPAACPGSALAGISEVSAGWDHSLALDTTGTVYAWGFNGFGQLGNNPAGCVPGGAPVCPNSAVPVLVAFPPGTPPMIDIAAGSNFSLSLDNTGQVWSWGYNGVQGELGQGAGWPIGPWATKVPAKAVAPANANVTAIEAGADHSLALTNTGGVLCWGLNNWGQCANAGGPVPGAVAGIPAMTDIAGGGLHSLALDTTGQVWSWGWNRKGELGAPCALGAVCAPQAVAGAGGVSDIAAGWQHSLAITTPGGAVLAWGWNASGQLGNNAFIDSNAPVNVLAPCNAGVSLIAAGYAHSLCV
ncbi:MAG TPA: hypothetical protein VGK51_06550 [Actinomycetota bacterium]